MMMVKARSRNASLACVFAALIAAACAPSGAPGASSGTGTAPSDRPPAPKRVTVAVAGDPHTLYQKFNPSSTVHGIEELERVVHAGLSLRDIDGNYRPQLAEQVPSLENGLRKLSPDGRMETTWKIRADARWHDGTPVTARDAAFAATVGQDRDLQILREQSLTLIEAIEIPDVRTVTVRWKQPYIEADRTFSTQMALPLPSHILESSYQTDKAGFANLPYWTEDFVGAGPFKLREFARSSHMVLEANDAYVLGRPRLDTIEVRFIPDPTTLLANVLAGSVEMALGRGLSLEQGLQARNQWREGKAEMAIASFVQVFPQLLTPDPAAIGDPQFRRALLHAIDRQEMVDSIQSGVVPVAHVFVSPDEPEYRDLEPSVVKYAYDLRRATQMVEQLGFTKGTDGLYRDPSGQRLAVELRATAGDLNSKTMFSVADYWQRLGLATETVSIPPQRASDLEYRANFPGFAVQRQGGELRFVDNFHSSQARTRENRFAGSNNTRYMNPELDILIDRYLATIPRQERMQVAAQAVNHITDRVVELPLFYDTQPALIANRLANVFPASGNSQTAWNAHEWDVK
jgi:peptide/nickel transport system substrate-binding protein